MPIENPDPRTPVIIGVGQFLDRDSAAGEPVDLMVEAITAAEADTTRSGALTRTDVVAVVPTFSWRYRDPGALIRDRIGAPTSATWYATVGGNTPQLLVNRLAGAISRGELDQAVLCGGESGRTRRAAKRDGVTLDWATQDDSVVPTWMDETPFIMAGPGELARNIVMPLQAYPLFENALWHHSGRSLEDHLATVGEIWAGFSRVAEANPYAWNRQAFTAEEITTPTDDNRTVGWPYTKRMVSNPDVNMASAAIICSVERARELGVPSDRWVFVHAGTDGRDRSMSERRDFHSSPAIGVAGNRALELAGIGIDDVAHLDLYSCYPSAVQLAIGELGVDPTRQLTVYGGLAFAGGPWNNPVGHAIAAMVDELRADPGSTGLVTANGGHVDKHSFGVYSTTPPAEGFRYDRPQDLIDAVPGVDAVVDAEGPATIETWTVMFGRDAAPERAHAAVRLPDGARTWAVTSDPDTMKSMVGVDMTGAAVTVGAEGELSLD